MTELKYDPELPFVVRIRFSEELLGRFQVIEDATQFSETLWVGYDTEVIDTTPKPKIPDDAEFIFVEDGDQSVFARREGIIAGEMHWLLPGAYVSEAALIEDFIGDAEVTVLVRKEDS